MAHDYPIRFSAQLRQHLRALRKRRGLTQAQLAALVGVSQARIAEIEANPGLVSFDQVVQLLSALGVTISLCETPSALGAAEPPRKAAEAAGGLEPMRKAAEPTGGLERMRKDVKAAGGAKQTRKTLERMDESTALRDFLAPPKKGSW